VLSATFKKKWKLTTRGVTLRIVARKNVDKRVGFTILQGITVVRAREREREREGKKEMSCLRASRVYMRKHVDYRTEKEIEHCAWT